MVRHPPRSPTRARAAVALARDGGRRLRAALAAVLVPAQAPELALVRQWLDSWRGVGQVAEGMHRARWDLQLTEYGDGRWRATFYVPGLRTPSWAGRRGSQKRGQRYSERRGQL